jgi:hypothetical protein
MANDNWCICGYHKDKHCISGIDHSNKTFKFFLQNLKYALKFSPKIFYHKNNHSIPPERLTRIFIK